MFNEYFSSVGARVAAELRSDGDSEPAVERVPSPVTACSSSFARQNKSRNVELALTALWVALIALSPPRECDDLIFPHDKSAAA